MLPHIMGRLRLIWSLSPFWGVPERITCLLRQFSSQIIAICTRAVSIRAALTGDVDPVIQALQASQLNSKAPLKLCSLCLQPSHCAQRSLESWQFHCRHASIAWH